MRYEIQWRDGGQLGSASIPAANPEAALEEFRQAWAALRQDACPVCWVADEE